LSVLAFIIVLGLVIVMVATCKHTNVPESHMDTRDICVCAVKVLGADGSPTIEGEHFQSPASVIPIHNSHVSFGIYRQFATL